jgi:hypothetical protein
MLHDHDGRVLEDLLGRVEVADHRHQVGHEVPLVAQQVLDQCRVVHAGGG